MTSVDFIILLSLIVQQTGSIYQYGISFFQLLLSSSKRSPFGIILVKYLECLKAVLGIVYIRHPETYLAFEITRRERSAGYHTCYKVIVGVFCVNKSTSLGYAYSVRTPYIGSLADGYDYGSYFRRSRSCESDRFYFRCSYP